MRHESSSLLRQLTAALPLVALLAMAPACGSTVEGGGVGGNDTTTTTTTTGTGTGTATVTNTTEEVPCVVGGCSGQTCEEAGSSLGSTCEWADVYACYQALGICERDAAGACGFRQTSELSACVAAGGRLPASGPCVSNAGDACTSDADCQVGGCGGEVCHNPALSSGASTCDCSMPVGPSCGCVGGLCAWWNAP